MLSIVVSWRDRLELAQALPSLLAVAEALGGDVTVVNFGGAPKTLKDQIDRYRDRVQVIEAPSQSYFNKARAQNLGALHTGQQVLFFCDCDIILDALSVTALALRIAEDAGVFATLARVREMTLNSRGAHNVVRFGYQLNIRLANGRELRIDDHEEDARDGTRHAPGLLLVRRDDFVAIDGYNGRLHGWGWEDQDMIARLTLGRGLSRRVGGEAIHISHNDAARIAHYPVTDRWESRDRMFRQALANYDRDDFLGTYHQDCREIASRRL